MDLSGGILIASSNKSKIEEIKQIFSKLENIKIFSLSDLNLKELDIKEDGKTFKENAYKKAYAYASKYSLVTLSDDSGLEVDYLGGEPGVKSARYAGENSSADDLIKKLLFNLEGVGPSQRTARFKCMVCLYNPSTNESVYSEGVCEGSISTHKIGTNGFGYDPIFFIGETKKTMAELSKVDKNQVSHRFKALDSLKIAISELFIK